GYMVLLRGSCAPRVYLDGIRAFHDGNMIIDNLVSPMDLEGIEVYRSSAEVPVQYGGMDAGCGAILIWSRRGEE
ncbi:MAG: Plug domain-containing protein, partial [Gemmatimonadota bacterium]|nr:Plug domain-containing protein [Gemmatimonadota bacterium]